MNNTTKQLIYTALFPAMMAATAGIAIPLGSFPAITMQTFFVYMAGLLLKPKYATLSMIIYVVLGAMGVPVFAGFNGGINVLVGPSGGFLIGFIIVSGFVAFMKNVKIINNQYLNLLLILGISTALLYMIGATYIGYLYNMRYWLVLAGFAPYLVGDSIKILTVIYVYVRIRSHVTYEYA